MGNRPRGPVFCAAPTVGRFDFLERNLAGMRRAISASRRHPLGRNSRYDGTMPSPTDSRTDPAPFMHCPECGSQVRAGEERCWLCHAQLPAGQRGRESFRAEDGPVAGSPARNDSRPSAAASQQFSLATILLVITLIAVCLGVLRISPGFGIAVLVFAVPALIRTVVVGAQVKSVGQRLSIGEKLTAFAASLGIMILVGIAGVVAFQIACWGTCGVIMLTADAAGASSPNESILYISVAIGSLAALAVGLWIMWLTRPRKR